MTRVSACSQSPAAPGMWDEEWDLPSGRFHFSPDTEEDLIDVSTTVLLNSFASGGK